MKRRIATLAAVFCLATASAALAQAPGGGGQNRGAQRLQALLQGITLTPAQQTRIDSIMTAYTAKMGPMTPGQQPDSATRVQRRTMSMSRDSTIRAALTADQQKVWDQNLATMRANMPQRP